MHKSEPVFNSKYTNFKSGFTLIELLIVLAIMSILAAIAYPSYSDYVTKSRRSDGQLALLESIQQMERCKSTRYTYLNCTLASTNSPEGHYELEVVTTGTSYTITATGLNQQASDTDCKVMTINHQGSRTPAESMGCWPS